MLYNVKRYKNSWLMKFYHVFNDIISVIYSRIGKGKSLTTNKFVVPEFEVLLKVQTYKESAKR